MLTSPTPQRALRELRPFRLAERAGRAANTVAHQAALSWRLTDRDRWIARMVHEHRVLTSHQITAMAFPSFRSGRQRLRELYLWSVLDRFQPHAPSGTAAQHYVLGPAGAAVLAAEHGLDPTRLGYRRDRVNAIAYSLRLAHTVGVNDWFAALTATTTTAPTAAGAGGRMVAWWSEARCGRHFGDLVRPDGYGRYAGPDGREVEFFFEYDTGTEALDRLAAKLPGYVALAAATGITTPVLIWLPTVRREAAARRLLRHTLTEITPDGAGQGGGSDGGVLPVATAAVDLLDPITSRPSPAEQVWLPLTGRTRGGRCRLAGLVDAWPWLPPPTPTGDTLGRPLADPERDGQLPPPSPTAPIPRTSPRAGRTARARSG